MSSKRVNVSVKVKLEAIEKCKKGAKQVSVAKELGVGSATIRGWIKDEAKLRKFVENIDESEGLERKRARLAKDDELDKALLLWFKEQRAIGTPLSGPIIKEKAKILAKKLKPDEEFEFEASDGWFWRWQKRHGIQQNQIHGESRSADHDAASVFPDDLKIILNELCLVDEQIYNADEGALFWKLLPNKTQDFKQNKTNSGYKKQKDRFTLLFAANKTVSHKLKLLFVGKSRNPRVLKNVNRKNLPVIYDNSRNAWMTQVIFKRWFFDNFIPAVLLHLRNKGLEEKAILLIDNCKAHPEEKELVSSDKKIKAIFLPATTTSLIQPMDQGVIATFKKNYRRNLICKLLMSEDEPLPSALKKVNLKDAMYFSEEAWAEVKSTTISKCWLKLFKSDVVTPVTQEDESLQILVQQVESLGLNVTENELNDWVHIDDDEPIYETLSDDQIIAEVLHEKIAINDESSEDEDASPSSDVVSMTEAVELLEKAYTAYETCNSNHITEMQLVH